jgi:hypothetical protein
MQAVLQSHHAALSQHIRSRARHAILHKARLGCSLDPPPEAQEALAAAFRAGDPIRSLRKLEVYASKYFKAEEDYPWLLDILRSALSQPRPEALDSQLSVLGRVSALADPTVLSVLASTDPMLVYEACRRSTTCMYNLALVKDIPLKLRLAETLLLQLRAGHPPPRPGQVCLALLASPSLPPLSALILLPVVQYLSQATASESICDCLRLAH